MKNHNIYETPLLHVSSSQSKSSSVVHISLLHTSGVLLMPGGLLPPLHPKWSSWHFSSLLGVAVLAALPCLFLLSLRLSCSLFSGEPSLSCLFCLCLALLLGTGLCLASSSSCSSACACTSSSSSSSSSSACVCPASPSPACT